MVVGKHDPNAAAARVLTPFIASDGVVGYGSPAASADSMFCRLPIRLKSPIGMMTVKKVSHSLPCSGSTMSATLSVGGQKRSGSAGQEPCASPLAHARAVPTATATQPPEIGRAH